MEWRGRWRGRCGSAAGYNIVYIELCQKYQCKLWPAVVTPTLYRSTKLNYWISGISTDLNILNLHSSVFNGGEHSVRSCIYQGNVKPFISHHEMLPLPYLYFCWFSPDMVVSCVLSRRWRCWCAITIRQLVGTDKCCWWLLNLT